MDYTHHEIENSTTYVVTDDETGYVNIHTQGGDEGVAHLTAREAMAIVGIIATFMSENMDHDDTTPVRQHPTE